LIPLLIINSLGGEKLPIYGDGMNIRDWLYVDDHCRGIELVLNKGRDGEVYNIGGNCEKTNLEIVEKVCAIMDELTPLSPQHSALSPTPHSSLIEFVKDRPGHDRRYAIDSSKITKELGFAPQESFASGIQKTIEWYLKNESWWRTVMNGSYQEWIDKQYG
jgi:dTDP-glucose 4,6-dehydratase